jgi:hypothetical protein
VRGSRRSARSSKGVEVVALGRAAVDRHGGEEDHDLWWSLSRPKSRRWLGVKGSGDVEVEAR